MRRVTGDAKAAGSEQQGLRREMKGEVGVFIYKCNPEPWKWCHQGMGSVGKKKEGKSPGRKMCPFCGHGPPEHSGQQLFSVHWWNEGQRGPI